MRYETFHLEGTWNKSISSPSQSKHSNPISLSKYSITVPLESDTPEKAQVQNEDTILDSKQF